MKRIFCCVSWGSALRVCIRVVLVALFSTGVINCLSIVVGDHEGDFSSASFQEPPRIVFLVKGHYCVRYETAQEQGAAFQEMNRQRIAAGQFVIPAPVNGFRSGCAEKSEVGFFPVEMLHYYNYAYWAYLDQIEAIPSLVRILEAEYGEGRSLTARFIPILDPAAYEAYLGGRHNVVEVTVGNVYEVIDPPILWGILSGLTLTLLPVPREHLRTSEFAIQVFDASGSSQAAAHDNSANLETWWSVLLFWGPFASDDIDDLMRVKIREALQAR